MLGISTILFVSALVPNAFGSMMRRLDAESYQAAMLTPPPYCLIENGFDYVGNDLTNVPGTVDDCCKKCMATTNCRAWSWSDYNNGTCWLKHTRGEIVVNANVKSALLSFGSRTFCSMNNDIDYVGNDLTRVDGAKAEDCCDKCRTTLGCRAYSWSDYQGGSCWLKTKVTQIINKPGVVSAQLYTDTLDGCMTVQKDLDYVGNDIANKPSASYAGCCDLCKATPNCRAYSWSNHNGGTCWLKSRKGQVITNAGVTSSQLYPNPPDCTIEKDTDYVDNDIGNAAGKDATECCDKCRNFNGCQAFAWSNHNGGTCWFKSKKGTVVAKPGVNAGTI